MNKSVIGVFLIFLGCGQQKEGDLQEKAVDVPIKKISYTYFRTYDPKNDCFEQELVLVKERKNNKIQLTYLESLMSDMVKEDLTVFTDTADHILLFGDTCKLVGHLQLTFPDTINTLTVYDYNLEGVVDEESFVVLDEAMELNIIWSVPNGSIHVFDPQSKEEGYFIKLEKELIHFRDELINASKQRNK